MPTPGGLPKGGDKLVRHDDPCKDIYIVVERTSSTAPFSVWVRREDGHRIVGFRSENLRARGTEARISCETGRLPGSWRNYVPSMDDPVRPEPPENPGMEGRRYPRARHILFKPAKRPSPSHGEEVDMVVYWDPSRSTSITLSNHDLLEMITNAAAYLRDNAEGLAGP